MAAYAALVSLMNTMDQIHTHPRFSTSLHKYQTESLAKKVDFFLDYIESYNSHGSTSEETEYLEIEIASAANTAEDVIESHIVDRIHNGRRSLLDLQKIIADMDSIEEKVAKVKEGRGVNCRPADPVSASSSRPLTTEKTAMVGFDGHLYELLDVLTGQQAHRQIIPIIGMGGIGKTTLARNVYENPLIVQHFDVRAWVTVSQEYNVREILFETLSCLNKPTSGNSEDQLGEQLHKTLSGRRYLIVLDDIWSVEAWDKIKFFFPDNDNRSRIVVTTRLSDVANDFGSSRLVVNFLDDDKSWNLFCEKAFAQESCPPEFVEIGKKIVRKCNGLPLSIVVIGGILGKSSRTQECWENVAKDISSIVNSNDNNQCMSILSLSYSHLPAHLKSCFLHLGIFPEDHEIPVSRLIKLWVAEGFLKPNKDQTLEEIAEGCVRDLIDRNLILTRRLSVRGRLKTCCIHDLVRDLCLKRAEKEKFLCLVRLHLETPQDIYRERRIIIQDQMHPSCLCYPWLLCNGDSTSSLARVLIDKKRSMVNMELIKCRLLRVLTEDDYRSKSLGVSIQQVNLRFIAQPSSFWGFGQNRISKIPSSIFRLWNVQTLLIYASFQVEARSKIWKMSRLRHLKSDLISLSDPPPSHEQDDSVVLRNLQTLKTAKNLRFSEEACKRMPNIKKLYVSYTLLQSGVTSSSYCLYNVGCLNKLESLKCDLNGVLSRDDFLRNLTFPCSLKKLKLSGCKLHWNDMTIIGSLPNLELVELGRDSVVGTEWKPVEGEFCSVKFLILDGVGLTHWIANETHFPVLQNLDLRELEVLDEVPSGIGGIPTLRGIYLKFCSISTAISAIKILEEQESLGNQDLQLEVCVERDMEQELRETYGFTGDVVKRAWRYT